MRLILASLVDESIPGGNTPAGLSGTLDYPAWRMAPAPAVPVWLVGEGMCRSDGDPDATVNAAVLHPA